MEIRAKLSECAHNAPPSRRRAVWKDPSPRIFDSFATALAVSLSHANDT